MTSDVSYGSAVPPPILVLGVGNILLGDEGVGVRTIEALQAGYDLPDSVQALDGGTAGMDLMDLIAGRTHVIVVDAVRLSADPGTTIVLRGEEVPQFFRAKISPHQLGISDVLAALTLLDLSPDNLTLIGIVPQSLELGLELSPLLASKVDVLLDLIVVELARLEAHATARV